MDFSDVLSQYQTAIANMFNMLEALAKNHQCIQDELKAHENAIEDLETVEGKLDTLKDEVAAMGERIRGVERRLEDLAWDAEVV